MHFNRSIVLGYHSIPKIDWGSFRGRLEEKWGLFWCRYHFGVDLGIISGLGIISVSGSFRGLYRAFLTEGRLIQTYHCTDRVLQIRGVYFKVGVYKIIYGILQTIELFHNSGLLMYILLYV